ncbi:MAG: tetratricopeptide repeat protein [Edaphobacter sp.]|nr:tetratricopeptide repeat protein [Edaphobacter sp.]
MNQVGQPKVAIELIGRAISINPSFAPYHNNLGNAFKGTGEISKGKASFQRALSLNPKDVSTYVNLGLLLESQGDWLEADKSYQSALRYEPSLLQALIGRGNASTALGDHLLASSWYEKAVLSSPDYAPAHNSLGNAQLACCLKEDAKTSYLRAVELDPLFGDAHFNVGNIYFLNRQYAFAVECYEHCIQLKPADLEAHTYLGGALAELGDTNAAIRILTHALSINPLHARAHLFYGNALAKRGDQAGSIKRFETAIRLDPHHSESYTNLGVAQETRGDVVLATESFRRALEFKANDPITLTNLGCNLIHRGDREGISYLERALQHDPEAANLHGALGEALLTFGEHASGWKEFEWRWQLDEFATQRRSCDAPLWTGEPLTDKIILLHAEQGFGDTLQFCRYVPLVAELGGTILLEVQAGLYRLLEHTPGVTKCFRRGDRLPEFNIHCPLMSLPLMLFLTESTIPPPLDYRNIQSEAQPERSNNLAETLSVGLVWAGNPTHVRDAFRSLSLQEMYPLSHVEHVSFVSLQMGPASSATNDIASFPMTQPCMSAIDFYDTAKILEDLDLVITVDTAVAHLAGSMGKLVWILVPEIPDWRWGHRSETTLWYPTAKLFRCSSTGGWRELMKKVVSELTILRDAKRHSLQPSRRIG